MGLHIFWPASACLTLFVVGVIMMILKFGPNTCGRAQERFSQIFRYKNYRDDDENLEVYDREVSESIA